MATTTATTTPVSVTPLLVGGKAWHCDSAEPLNLVFPGDGQTRVGQCPLLPESQIPEVLCAAEETFQAYKRTTPTQRSGILRNLARLLDEHTEPLARLITLETGKPLKMATVEVSRAVTVCTGYANVLEWGSSQSYYIEEREAHVRYFPLGPVLAITPYNFPLNLVVHKLAPAIGAGNSITIKPASKTPLTALYLGRLAVEAGYPAISVIPCKSGVAESLVKSDVFKKLSFTGSHPVGWRLKSLAGKKVVTMELGGNAGCIIESIPDAPGFSMESVALRCAQGSFWLSGQSCISVQRLFVKREIYESFLTAFTAAARSLKVGDPLSRETDIGAMISSEDVTRAQAMVKEAVARGAKVILGGDAVSPTIMNPTILAHTTPEMPVNCEECFAPIVTVTPYDTFEEALSLVNDSDFGLQAGIFTRDRNQANLAYETLDVGGLIINDVPTFRLDYLPYGGVKDSGLGREGVLTGIAEMSFIKTMIIKP